MRAERKLWEEERQRRRVSRVMVRGGRGYGKWVDKGLKNGERMNNGGGERL